MLDTNLGKEVVDAEDVPGSASIASGSGETTICSLQAKHGNRVFIKSLANAVDAGAEPYITWRFKRNKSEVYPYSRSGVGWSDPTDPKPLPKYLEVNGGDLIEITAESSSGTTYGVYARLQVVYVPFGS